jgi:putative ABC transport system permease protein
MRAALRQFRRAPARIIASIFALSLAIGAVGVLAVPAVARQPLRDVAERDGLADLVINTTPLDSDQLAAIAAINGVATAEGSTAAQVDMGDGDVTVVGMQLTDQRIDRLRVVDGRLPVNDRETLASPGFHMVGDDVTFADSTGEQVTLRVVGHGDTLWFSGTDTLYTTIPSALAITSGSGIDRVTVLANVDTTASLQRITDEIRTVISARNDTFTSFSFSLPGDRTPIEEDIEQVSSLVGLLGVAAGLVALVLLASTTNTLITERSRETAVMRALGATSRPLRRRLRRIALGITAAALVIGLPLGVLIANLIARLVLDEFVGITPKFGFSTPVLVLSAAGALIGARAVSARAARRVTKLPLAEALRDRDGAPFGRRFGDRVLARIPTGGLLSRVALRSSAHRRSRATSVVLQIAAGVGALLVITSLTASVNGYNAGSREPWQWSSLTTASQNGLPFDDTVLPAGSNDELAIRVDGEIKDWDLDVFGVAADTAMFRSELREGRWLSPTGTREAVVSAGFASRRDITVGDSLPVELTSGNVGYTVVGTVNDFGRALYVDVEDLAADLGSPDRFNLVMSAVEAPTLLSDAPTSTQTMAQLAKEGEDGRASFVLIFGAIAAIVTAVAALAVVSTMSVNLYERRHEFAAVQAIGGARRTVRGLIARELLPLGVLGIGVGLGAGYLGTRGIIGSFEASNSIDIGTVFATRSLPAIISATLIGVLLLAAAVARGASRRPIAPTLRGAV